MVIRFFLWILITNAFLKLVFCLFIFIVNKNKLYLYLFWCAKCFIIVYIHVNFFKFRLTNHMY